jgi:hypothetical protein
MARHPVPAAVAVLAALIVAVASAEEPRLVSSDDSGIVLQYSPGSVSQDPLSIGGREYVRLSVDGADMIGLPGAPDLPVMRVTLAVPDCDRVLLDVVTDGSTARTAAPVIPALTTLPGLDGELARYSYEEGPQYSERGLWPPSAAAMTEPRWLSRQRVIHLELYPCQFDPETNEVLSHESIEVALRFEGLRDGAPPRRTSPSWERLYRSTLLNYEESSAWRSRPAATSGRPDEYFDTSTNWLKLTLDGRGIYRMGYEDLSTEIDPSTVDPASIRIFTGPGLSLPASVFDPRPDWMEECDIRVVGEEDGVFDPGDEIIFYGVGTDGWSDELMVDGGDEPYHENRFAGTAVYWMTWESEGTPFSEEPARMTGDDLQDVPDALPVDDFRARRHYEQNRYDFFGRGDNYHMFEMKKSVPESWYSHNALHHVVSDSSGVLRARVFGNSVNFIADPDHRVYFYLNGVEAFLGEWNGYSQLVFETGGLPIRDYRPDEPGDDYNTFEVFVPREGSGYEDDNIVIDWFDIEYWRELWADEDPDDGESDDELAFGSSGRTGVLEYSVGGFTEPDVSVYKILDRYTVRLVPGVTSAGVPGDYTASFQDDVADTVSYIALSSAGYRTPGISRDVRQDLRYDTDMSYVMIVYDGFYDEALRLGDYRRSAEGGGHDVRVVKVSDVYDEFSWGLLDPTAIRDYLKFLNDNADVPPSHVLLIGDATTDYRHYQSTGIECFMPTWYTGGQEYWPTDVWFVGFDADVQYEPGMAIGRLSVRSSSELSTIIEKIRRYEQETVTGIWKNTVILVGDDEWRANQDDPNPHFELEHTRQAEQIAREVLPWPLDVKKIYLMEYEFDGAWHKPRARADLVEAWSEGSLIMNYTGHGNELLMAHELVFSLDDIPRLRNLDRLPLFFAASCRLNKFDIPNSDSVGELLVKSSVGGSIASIGSTRDSGAGYNSSLNRGFLSKVFGEQREAPTTFADLGQAMQAGFVETATHYHIWLNNTKFSLIGDPALKLVSPSGFGSFEDGGPEQMRRRDTVSLSGTNAGATEAQSGIALVRVSDSADTSGYTQPQSGEHVDYWLPGETVFEGAAVVSGGTFSSSLVVSALAEEGPHARVRAYFYGEDADGSFSVEDVALADSVEVSDGLGPDISMLFEGGGTAVLPGDQLEIRFYDESGINLVNRDQSDAILLAIDASPDSTDVTDDFSFDTGSFTEGAIDYVLPSLGLGNHSVSVAASDNMGNRSTATLLFEIVSSTDFTIRNVANFPNPFSGGGEGTRIMFQLPVSAEVSIDVFTVGGRRVRHMPGLSGQVGANEIYWDGLDQQGDELANGVYLFRIHAVSDEYRGDKADAIGRAVIMR